MALQRYRNAEMNRLYREIGLESLFHNSLDSVGEGDFVKYKRRGLGYGLENWKDLTYNCSGEIIKIPSDLRKYREWVEKQKSEKPRNIRHEVVTMVFNPDLAGDNIYSVAGDTYNDLECKYMIPVFAFKHIRHEHIGNMVRIYEVDIVAVMYCKEGDPHYGRIGFFMGGLVGSLFNIALKDAWGILKWIQPKFNIDVSELISMSETTFDKTAKLLDKLKGKLKTIFKGKEKKFNSEAEAKAYIAKYEK